MSETISRRFIGELLTKDPDFFKKARSYKTAYTVPGHDQGGQCVALLDFNLAKLEFFVEYLDKSVGWVNLENLERFVL